jgi:two-component system, OmpR family, phosphate regulon sensor histidine kinase PhoR
VFGRFFSLLLLLITGATLGYVWAQSQELHATFYLVVGSLIGAMLWWFWDAMRGLRVVSWLRSGDLDAVPNTFGLWGAVVDRTRRLLRERERAITASEQRLKDFLSAIQASPNGVVLLDENFQIEWCNQTAAFQLGIEPERDIAQRIGNLVRDPIFSAYMTTSDVSEPIVIEGRGKNPNMPLRISIQRHPYGEGKQLLITRDVTVVEQAEAMRRDFVANVSHEIRTPLTVLAGFVETLQTLKLSQPEQDNYLALMATQAQRMQSLVDDLLTLSRLEGSPIPGFSSHITLSHLMDACQSEAQQLSKLLFQEKIAQVIVFETDPAIQNYLVLGEPRELQSALSNLVSNAVRYTPQGGRIDVQAFISADGNLNLQVKDTGPGIPPEHLPRLTERFYRVDRSRSRESGGTGLGLAIVKHVMQRHGGQLQIASIAGQGSCFNLIFPPTRWKEVPAA